MAKRKLKKADAGGNDEPDLTPMIDVIFLLIIFFLIAGRMIQAGRPEINVPIAEKSEKAGKDDMRTEFTIDSQGNLYHMDRPIGSVGNTERMTEIIEQKRSVPGGDKLQVYLRVDSEATYQDVKKVMGAAAKAKQQKIMFAAFSTET
jgi:biopolymer transport protein ExbD